MLSRLAVLAVLCAAGCAERELAWEVQAEVEQLQREMPIYQPVRVVLYPAGFDWRAICLSPYWGYQLILCPGPDWPQALRHEWEHAAGVRPYDAPAGTIVLEGP
jgi:hypothetical protein